MPTQGEHIQHLKLRTSSQMEMQPTTRAGSSDYDDKLKAAQVELERIQQQREELERQKQELEDLTLRKQNFVGQQIELSERLAATLTMIDRELYAIRQEGQDLEQTRALFASHLDKIQKISPESWTRENLSDRLDKANVAVELAADDFEQAANHFEGSRSGEAFGRAGTGRSNRSRSGLRSTFDSEFNANLKNGFAFNLPLLLLGALALIIYLLG